MEENKNEVEKKEKGKCYSGGEKRNREGSKWKINIDYKYFRVVKIGKACFRT